MKKKKQPKPRSITRIARQASTVLDECFHLKARHGLSIPDRQLDAAYAALESEKVQPTFLPSCGILPEALLEEFVQGGPTLWTLVRRFIKSAEVQPESAWGCVFDLAHVVEDGLRRRYDLRPRPRHSPLRWEAFATLMCLPASVLSLETIHLAQEALVTEANNIQNLEERGRVLRGAHALVSSAKSAFCKRHRQWLPKIPPELLDFANSAEIVAPAAARKAVSLADFSRFMTRFRKWARSPKNFGAVIITVLCLYCKCRLSDAIMAKSSWLSNTATKPYLTISSHSKHRRKKGDTLVAPILPLVHTLLLAAGNGQVYLAGLTWREREQAAAVAREFLRETLCPGARSPLQVLRCYCVSAEEVLLGSVAAAQKSFGHKQAKTTLRYILEEFTEQHFRRWHGCSFVKSALAANKRLRQMRGPQGVQLDFGFHSS